MSPVLAAFFDNTPMTVTLLCAVLGLLAAGWLIRGIFAAPTGNEKMRFIAGAIEQGAKAYLGRQISTISVIAVAIAALVFYFKDAYTAVGFVIGAICSMAAGFIGMRIAVMANIRTAQGATESRRAAMRVAFNGGAVTGLLVVGLALLSVAIFYLAVDGMVGQKKAIDSLIGLALGASLISVFARLGGGIYTKAADVGADLVGKVEQNLNEDDPRNPATVADNVGDNVGDCAGMAADVFETYAVSLIGAVLIGFLTAASGAQMNAVVLPFLLGGISIVTSIVGIVMVNAVNGSPSTLLMGSVAVSSALSAVAYWPAIHYLFPQPVVIAGATRTPGGLFVCALVGLVLTFIVVLITNYYTSTEYSPVRKIAEASKTGHATNIIAGLAIGMQATALPVLFIGASILLSYNFGGLYGVAVAAMSMLSMAGIIVSLDAFGPITDNAGGVAVMSEMPESVRKTTDELDAVGNTMKAVTKGYAIASAGLAALVLFGSYVEELKAHLGRALVFSLEDPLILIGLFIGGLLPFLFSAFSMSAVGRAAGAVVEEVRRQIKAKPGILTGADTPEYGTCVDIVTKAALREMIVPSLLPVLAVLIVAAVPALGAKCLGGMLVGTIVTGLFMGIAMTSSGGAWDNAKKYIEEGNLGGKGSEAHKAAVTGDTVGDPYKDTSGPAINPMIKVVNVVAILVIPIFFK